MKVKKSFGCYNYDNNIPYQLPFLVFNRWANINGPRTDTQAHLHTYTNKHKHICGTQTPALIFLYLFCKIEESPA